MTPDSTETKHPIPGLLALSPALVFIILYVVVSIIIGDFYVMPITIALIASGVWGIAIYRGPSLANRIEVFSRAAGHSNILYMVWIFVLAGAFAAIAKRIGAIDATVEMTLSIFPPSLILPAIFIAACFISLSIGTSVGTVVALVPLVVDLARSGGGDVALFTAAVLGGAFFGDNLSFISDTTIASTRTQGCKMSDKFRANFAIVLPAAIATLTLYVILGSESTMSPAVTSHTPWWLMIPYLVIIVTALMGINVTIVLLAGIVSALVLGAFRGLPLLEACTTMGQGVDSVGQLIVITLLASGMLGLVKAMGGISYLLRILTARVSSKRGAQFAIATIVSLVNVCTANNTVAIITVGSISRDISRRYGIAPRKAASLLDTCSCVVQCLIPYGAQTLLATGLAGLSPADPWPYLYYPWALAVAVIVSTLFTRKQKAKVVRNCGTLFLF